MFVEIPYFLTEARVTLLTAEGFVQAGQVLARCEGVETGITCELHAQRDCEIRFTCEDQSLLEGGSRLLYVRDLEAQVDPLTVGLWMSSHSAFRAQQAIDGQGGQVAAAGIPVHAKIQLGDSLDAFVTALEGTALENGDTVVIADKPVAIAQGRVIPRQALAGIDPKFLTGAERRALAREMSERFGMDVNARQLLMIDHVDDETASLGAIHHNEVCRTFAELIQDKLGLQIDVVIADSDTGVDCGEPLIGVPTVGATPLGATAGLSFYETMRVTAVGELSRGHTREIPIVICKSSKRNQVRKKTGEARPYPGMIHLTLETEFHRGFPTTICWKVK